MGWYVRNVRDGKWWDVGPRGVVTELVDDGDPQVGALLIVEGEERLMRAWDYFHCPPNVPHTIVGAGSGPAAILALGAREHANGDWGGYPHSKVAMKHDASTEEETTDPEVAYARFPSGKPTEFQESWLPN
jgi:hypothetical protein